MMSVLSVNKNNFEQIRKSEKTVLLDFYADWCAPCRMVSPLVDEIALENPQYLVGKINVDNEAELAQCFGVMSIPMLVVMKDGKIIEQGNHDTLLAQNGFYATLYNSQFDQG